MKLITVPGDIKVKLLTPQGEQEEAIPFKKFLVHQMDTFEQVKTRSQVRQADKIVKTIEESNGTISLEDADYKVLNDACSELRYIPKVNRQLIPYIDAIEKAEEVTK